MAQLKRKVTLKQKNSTEAKKSGNKKAWIIGLVMLPIIIILSILFCKSYTSNNSSEKISSEKSKNIVAAEKDTKNKNVSNDISQKESKEKEKMEDDAPSKEKEHITAKEQQKETSNSNTLASDNKEDSQQTKPKQKVTEVEIDTKEPKTQIPYKKGSIYKVYQFPFGKSDYSQSNPDLDKLVDVLKQNPTIKISISAYTDKVGDANYNKTLSERRAKAIRDYIANKGIEMSRLSFKGKGISTKYQSNSENRRAEFVLSE
jgi:outer membrane protein OmpA-like peptidoglycan-associated protein